MEKIKPFSDEELESVCQFIEVCGSSEDGNRLRATIAKLKSIVSYDEQSQKDTAEIEAVLQHAEIKIPDHLNTRLHPIAQCMTAAIKEIAKLRRRVEEGKSLLLDASKAIYLADYAYQHKERLIDGFWEHQMCEDIRNAIAAHLEEEK
jgi:hypothetical protein